MTSAGTSHAKAAEPGEDASFTHVLAAPLGGVTLTRSSGGHAFCRHWHDAYCFGLIDSGAQRWVGRCGRVAGYEGDIINTNPGEVHDGEPLGAPSRTWRMVSVAPHVMAMLSSPAPSRGEMRIPVIRDAELAAILRRLFEAIERWSVAPRPDLVLACEEALTAASVLLLTRHGTAPPIAGHTGSARVVRDFLADDPAHAPSLRMLAGLAGMSRFQLLRAFTREFGAPPLRWLQSLRAERARVLIRRGESLAAAAVVSGFADQSHMTRTFRRMYGYTPGQWQRATASIRVNRDQP